MSFCETCCITNIDELRLLVLQHFLRVRCGYVLKVGHAKLQNR
jgi:hypothetical protein